MAVAKAAGTWTYEDLFSLPDDGKRYEIIEGDLYEMPSPNWDHSTVIINLIALLLPIVRSLKGKLRTASVDVFFSGADPVVPDIFVILSDSRATGRGRGVQGPPDLVIEVLSPSNRSHDQVTKRALYSRAGVREYWIVDPIAQSVKVLSPREGALHPVQVIQGDGAVVSPLLRADFSLAEVFAELDDPER